MDVCTKSFSSAKLNTKMLIIFGVVFMLNFYSISSKCVYENYDLDYPPIFTQEFNSKEMILKPLGRSLVVAEGSFLKAYCDNNFTAPIFENARNDDDSASTTSEDSSNEGISSVKIKCFKGKLYYSDDEKRTVVSENKNLTCHNSQPGFYHAYNRCGEKGTSIVYGFTVVRRNISLSSMCYNTDDMEISYIRHVNDDHAIMLDEPNKENIPFNVSQKMPINFILSNELRSNKLNTFLKGHYEQLKDLTLFRFDHLIPIDHLAKGFQYDPQILERYISIPWWINLKDGNWKLFQDSLEKLTLLEDYEVFTGIAHRERVAKNIKAYDTERRNQYEVDMLRQREEADLRREEEIRRQEEIRRHQEEIRRQEDIRLAAKRLKEQEEDRKRQNDAYRHTNRVNYGPNHIPYTSHARIKRSEVISDFENQDVRYMIGSVVRTIPLYIWSHVKSRVNSTSSTVVIAINSPFVEAYQPNLEFCNNNNYRCPNWLEEHEATWKLPAFGYMFCCDPEQAKYYIKEIQ